MRNAIAYLVLLLAGAGLAGEAPGYVFPPSGGGGTISSGTAGYAAKYTASNTLGASGIYDAGAGEYTFAANGVSGPGLNLNVANITAPGRIWTVADRSQTWTAPTANDTGADVMWGASAADMVPLHLQAKAAQSVAILKISDSTGALMLDVGSTGVLNLAQGYAATKPCSITGASNVIQHRIIGFTNQTNPIFSVESGDGELIYQVCDPSVTGGDTFIHRWRFDTSSANDHWSITNSGSLAGRVNAGTKLQLVANEFVPSARLSSDTILGWNSNTSLTGDMDTGLIRHSAGSVKLNGYSGNGGDLVLTERSATPATNPTDGTECRTYMKGDKFIIQYNHGATIKYRVLDLTSTDATWTYTTTEP